ncbi:hypothetical protein U1Q18_042634 [Sarracenia purpurea var. burkii]
MLLLYGVAEKWSVVRGVFGLEHMVFVGFLGHFEERAPDLRASDFGYWGPPIFGATRSRVWIDNTDLPDTDARENLAPEYREAFGVRFEQEHDSVVVRVHAEWETGRNASRNEESALAVGDEVPDRRRGDERAVLSSPRLGRVREWLTWAVGAQQGLSIWARTRVTDRHSKVTI